MNGGFVSLQPCRMYIQGVPEWMMTGRKDDPYLFQPGEKGIRLTRNRLL